TCRTRPASRRAASTRSGACSMSASPGPSRRCGSRTRARRSAGAKSCGWHRAASSTSCPRPKCSAMARIRSPMPNARRNGRTRASRRSASCWAADHRSVEPTHGRLYGSTGRLYGSALPSGHPRSQGMPMRAPPILVLLSAALLGGCVSVQTHKAATPAVTAAPIEQGPLPDDSLNATVWYQTSVERDLITREVYRAAGRYLEQALADPAWDALPREDRDNDPAGLPPAIIVDVDETVLDNSAHQARL